MNRPIRGALLLEVLFSFGLFLLAALSVSQLVRYSLRGFSQAAETSAALHLAEENLERLRTGQVKVLGGTRQLEDVALQSGGSHPVTYRAQLTLREAGDVWLARSRVKWQSGGQPHQVEVKCYVTLP